MGLISYFKNKYYDKKLNKAETLLSERRAPEAEQVFISILDKQPQAAGKLAAYYGSLAPKSNISKVVKLFQKVIDLQSKGGTVYDKQFYNYEVKRFVVHIYERAIHCYESGSFQDCYSLLYALNSTMYKSRESIELCCVARIQIILQQIESTKTTDKRFKSYIEGFKSEWRIGKSITKAKDAAKKFCDKLESQKRFYAANTLLSIIDDASSPRVLGNAISIVFGNDVEASSSQIKETVAVYGKNIVLRNEQNLKDSISVFDICWQVSHDQDFVLDVFRSVNDKTLRDSLIDLIISNHSSYLSDTKLFDEFSQWVYEKVEATLSIETLEKIHILGYNSENLYVAKVHAYGITKPCDERIVLLDRAHSLFPNSSTIINDKLDCAQWYLNNEKNGRAISVANSILAKCDKACLIKAHAICNLANAESETDKKVDLLRESEVALGMKTGPEYQTVRECISFGYLGAAEKYYSQNAQSKAYDILHILSKNGYKKALVAISTHRLSEIRACDSVEQKLHESTNAISEIMSYNISEIAECAEFQSIWDEYIAADISKFKNEDDAKAISEFEYVLKSLEKAVFCTSIKNDKKILVTKELIRRKYLVARSLELSNNLEGALDQYKGINTLEANKTPTLSALRFTICKLKLQNNSDIIQHKERIYILLKNAADTFRAEKEDIAYRFALILLKSGENTEALAVLNEFLPNEEFLRKACKQGDMIKAQAKLEDFNNKLDAVKNRTLSSDDAIFFINHMLEYGKAIAPILQLTRPELSEYRNKLKNYAIFKLFDEGKFAVAFNKMIKEHHDYLDDLSALHNIALICLNMAEEKQLTLSNYEEVIAVWLTAIYQEKLFIKSLDYTSWDDNFTFSLYEAYGHFNEHTVGDKPDNVNFDDSDDSSIVPIREVQRALLSRFEAAIGDNQRYHEFFTSQKDAMDALIALNLDEKCRLVAPFLAKKDEVVFEDITNALEQDRMHKYDNWEDVLSVGVIYQLEAPIYTDYGKAKNYFDACNESIKGKNISLARQAFTTSRISLIHNFGKLFSALVSTANSKVSALSSKEKSEFKSNFNFYMIVCDALKDSTLSYVFSNYVMSFVVGQVNSNIMSKTEATDYILSIFLLDKTNIRVKENLTTLFEMLAREDDSGSVQAITTILSKLRSFDTAFYKKLNSEYEDAKIHKELNSIVNQVNQNSLEMSSALSRIYGMYSNNPNNEGICENLAQLSAICIMKYVVGQESGASSVLRTLDSLKANISTEFRKHRGVFKKQHDEIWNQLPSETKILLSVGSTSIRTLNEKGYALKRGLEYLRSLGGGFISW